MEENKREFQGIWIPREIWLDDRLNALDKIVFAEIHSFSSTKEKCWASNKYLAEFCQCSERKISQCINKLIELQYIKLISFDGRTRIIESNLCFTFKPKDINENKKLPNSKTKPPIKKQQKHKYGEYQNVLLTDKELEKLKQDYPNYKDLITFLDEYMEMTGKKYKSCYLAIKKWVVNAVNERKSKQKQNDVYCNSSNDWEDIKEIFGE